jgi:glucose-6-phosphate 1-epimerase
MKSLIFLLIGGIAMVVNGTERVELSSADGGKAVADAYGARLVSWSPAGGEEVFAMAKSRDKWPSDEQVHGGLPIYWPWFVFEGPEGCRIHGVTGYAEWRVAERAADRVVFALDDCETTRSAWPHRFHAELEYTLAETLSAVFRVTNTDTDAYECTEGFHPYFRVGDVSKCVVTGSDGTRYFWKGEAEKGDRRLWKGDFPCGNVATGKPGYVFEEKSPDGEHVHDLVDPVLGRTLRLSYEGNVKFVVWNSGPDFSPFGGADAPDYGRRFVCIEGATLYRDRAYALAPGETHTLKLTIQIARNTP